jgi:hypothetical protein
MLAPVALAQRLIFRKQLTRAFPFQELNRSQHRKPRWNRKSHMHVVAIDCPRVNCHFMRTGDLAQQLTGSLSNTPRCTSVGARSRLAMIVVSAAFLLAEPAFSGSSAHAACAVIGETRP